MGRSTEKIDVYLEVGKKRIFAGAVEWPGWCRSGRDEASALDALYASGERYAKALHSTPLGFQIPAGPSAFNIVERLEGDATTDFGAPSQSPTSDQRPVDEAELQRFQELLKACWQAFDRSASLAAGKELSKGPRGGGRDLEGIIEHVNGADAGYLSALGGKFTNKGITSLEEVSRQTRQTILEWLAAAARGEVPAQGPRGGVRWTPRYFVRRAAWHVLDHAWELENRST